MSRRRFNDRFPRRTTGSRGRNASERRQASFPAPDAGMMALLQQVSGILQGITVETGAPTDSIYIDAAGNIGLGANPGATTGLLVRKNVTDTAIFERGANGEMRVVLNAGDSSAASATLVFQDQGTDIWAWFKGTAGPLSVFDYVNSRTPLTIEQNAPSHSLRLETDGVRVGISGGDAAAVLEAVSTTQGFLPPRMTSTQRDNISSPPDGLVVYNTTDDCISLRANSVWEDLTFKGRAFHSESASRTINTTESAFTQLAGLSFPGPTNGTARYLVIWAVSVNTVGGSINVGIRVRMGSAGTTADAVQDYKLQLLQNIGAEEYTINGVVEVQPAASDVLTLTHITSGSTATAVVNADGRGAHVAIIRVA